MLRCGPLTARSPVRAVQPVAAWVWVLGGGCGWVGGGGLRSAMAPSFTVAATSGRHGNDSAPCRLTLSTMLAAVATGLC